MSKVVAEEPRKKQEEEELVNVSALGSLAIQAQSPDIQPP